MYNKNHNLKKNILLGKFLKRGSFDYIHRMHSNDAKGKHTCSITFAKLSYLTFNSCFTQLITQSYTPKTNKLKYIKM